MIIAALEQEFVNGFGARPRPTQTPRPPVWIAGSSPPAITARRPARRRLAAAGPVDRRDGRPAAVERERHGRSTLPMMIGHITPFLYVGDAGWEVGDDVLTGSAA